MYTLICDKFSLNLILLNLCAQVQIFLPIMEKYILLIVGIIWMFGNTCGVRHCPSNCDCSSEFWSTCEILYCDDDLDMETPFYNYNW